MAEKKRLDVLLFDLELVKSREEGKALIMAGKVYVDNQKVDKAGTNIDVTKKIEVRGEKIPYVSRGGLKLEKAIKNFGVQLENKVCMDIGASTGGFTDCMLQNGASKVFSVDVGYGQLAWKLRTDERVTNMERTNIRYVTLEDIGQPLDFFSVDVSFISLTLVLPVGLSLLKEGGEAVCLIKPQFEAGKGKVGKKGVVREPEIHIEVVDKIVNFVREIGFTILNLDFSPVKGPEGNIEYLIHIKKGEHNTDFIVDSSEMVMRSHDTLL